MDTPDFKHQPTKHLLDDLASSCLGWSIECDLDNVKRAKEKSWKRTLCTYEPPRQHDSRWVETPKRPHALRDSVK